ncbi:Pikachurin [Stylophora pistillata]|uniref:Pikachurin n=1 Tax=Stylophora pistillata TaxID=50429 RepID=A0A2B4RQZ6_STYPI|nr:Pikachurin [Stylophora pistillata]
MRLEKFVFKRMSASAPYICDIRCGEEIICQSYNYNRKKEICELNNRTKEARPENFRSAPDWFYIRRLNGRDIDECVNDSFICGVNATCVNTNGSYGCTCKEEESVEDGGFCSGKECRSIVFKEPIRDKVMKGHLIRLVDVPHQGSCNVLCYLEPNCVSINFGPSQGGNYICELNNASDESQGSSYLQSKQDHTYLSIENPCSSSPCFNNGTCQAGYTEKGFRCKCPLGFTGVNCKKACSFDFEDGIGAWEMTGRAFIYQPTFGDNPKARKRESAQQQGDWWIGDCERRPAKSDPAGKQHIDGCDPPVGTLTSPCFRIVGKMISFLIGGGCKVNKVRAELIVNNQKWLILSLLMGESVR